jgi:hypothetical protein
MQKLKKLWADNRGIEGLPIRLVIALVVGVASLAIMTSILGGLPTFESTEVEVNYDNEIVTNEENAGTGATTDVKAWVNTTDGEDVEDATLLVEGGTAGLENGPHEVDPGTAMTFTTDQADASVSSNDFEVNLRSDQDRGTIKISVITQSDSNYVDEQENAEIIVLKN